MREEWLNRIALTWGNRTRQRQLRRLLDQYPTAVEAAARHPEWLSRESLAFAEKELAFVEKHGIGLYYYKDANYPYRLAQCVDAPLLMYAKGNVNVDTKHVVSVVGTRIPSERGKDWCRRLVLDLAAKVPDLTIISGLAYGIDVVAHKAALEAGVPTVIIPAHGLDRIYPAVHRQVAVQALDKGGILTEYACGTEPERFNFVARNRIVAGLADALVVVESKKKGGSLITAEMAIDYGRDVFALPGRLDDVCSAGVFGGLTSGITEETTRVFIESAYFNPVFVRKTSKRHGIKTDASFRYERGADPEIVPFAAKYNSFSFSIHAITDPF